MEIVDLDQAACRVVGVELSKHQSGSGRVFRRLVVICVGSALGCKLPSTPMERHAQMRDQQKVTSRAWLTALEHTYLPGARWKLGGYLRKRTDPQGSASMFMDRVGKPN